MVLAGFPEWVDSLRLGQWDSLAKSLLLQIKNRLGRTECNLGIRITELIAEPPHLQQDGIAQEWRRLCTGLRSDGLEVLLISMHRLCFRHDCPPPAYTRWITGTLRFKIGMSNRIRVNLSTIRDKGSHRLSGRCEPAEFKPLAENYFTSEFPSPSRIINPSAFMTLFPFQIIAFKAVAIPNMQSKWRASSTVLCHRATQAPYR